jgi:hypothetical protein
VCLQTRIWGHIDTFGTLRVQAFPLSDVKVFMGHADIATTMISVHHVPQVDAADRLSPLIAGSDELGGAADAGPARLMDLSNRGVVK